MKLIVPHLRWGSVLVSFNDPGLVVAVFEGEQRQAELLDCIEPTQPEQVLLQGSNEALGAAITFWGAHEGR